MRNRGGWLTAGPPREARELGRRRVRVSPAYILCMRSMLRGLPSALTIRKGKLHFSNVSTRGWIRQGHTHTHTHTALLIFKGSFSASYAPLTQSVSPILLPSFYFCTQKVAPHRVTLSLLTSSISGDRVDQLYRNGIEIFRFSTILKLTYSSLEKYLAWYLIVRSSIQSNFEVDLTHLY